MTPTVENILLTYLAASDAEVAEGIAWYPDAACFSETLAGDYWHRAAGVIAALSPMQDWDVNMAMADRLYAQNGNGAGCGLSRNVAKAERIYHGEDAFDVLGGNKVRAFYACIIEPEGESVCVDRHAFDVAVGRVTDDSTRTQLARKGEYERFSDTYREAAALVGLPVPTLQAITWVAWRNRKGNA